VSKEIIMDNCEHEWQVYVTETVRSAYPIRIEDGILSVVRFDSMRGNYATWIEDVRVDCRLCGSNEPPSELLEKTINAFPIGREYAPTQSS
jgi:hypothetical protein